MKRVLLFLALVLGWSSARADHLEVIAGFGIIGTDGDGGPATSARLNNPFGLARGPDGALWCADFAAHVIRRIGVDGKISTAVGKGIAGYSGDDGPARAAALRNPHEIRFGPDGNLFIADTGNNVIRRLDVRTGIITTHAGTGQQGYSGDGGRAMMATFNGPISLQFDAKGDLFIADIGNHVIRRVAAGTGLISSFAGTGRPGPTPEGASISGTPLNGPRSLDFDAAGNLWLVTREGNQVLRLDLTGGLVHHVAGTGATGFSGDGGPALEATFAGPKGISVAGDGSVYLADTENHAIRRIDPRSGKIELVAGRHDARGGGGGRGGDEAESDPLKTRLRRPHGILVESDGSILISDSENHRILRIRR